MDPAHQGIPELQRIRDNGKDERESLMAAFSLDQVQQHRLFSGLNDEEWSELLVHLRPQSCPAAEVIFAEGDPGDSLYIVLSGKVELRRAYVRFGGDYLLATLESGQLFGESELILHHRRTATAVCLTSVRVAILSDLTLGRLSESIQLKVLRAWGSILSEHLYWRDQMVADLLEQRGSQVAATLMADLYGQGIPFQSDLGSRS